MNNVILALWIGLRLKDAPTDKLIYLCKYSGMPKPLNKLGQWIVLDNPLAYEDVSLIQFHYTGKESFPEHIIRQNCWLEVWLVFGV